MANNVIPGMAGIYVRSTGEHVSANIFGPSRHGDNYLPPTLSGDHHRLVPKKTQQCRIAQDCIIMRARC
jgi:hypothetical protein